MDVTTMTPDEAVRSVGWEPTEADRTTAPMTMDEAIGVLGGDDDGE